MIEARLKRMCASPSGKFTDSELVSVAFGTSLDFMNWDEWFCSIKQKFDRAETRALITAAVSVLKSLPAEADSFQVGSITPEHSATASLKDSDIIPRQFLVFLSLQEE